jgi:hypothetical protein
MTKGPRLSRPGRGGTVPEDDVEHGDSHRVCELHDRDTAVPGVRSHCRFENRDTEYVSKSGMEWRAVGQSDRATKP